MEHDLRTCPGCGAPSPEHSPCPCCGWTSVRIEASNLMELGLQRREAEEMIAPAYAASQAIKRDLRSLRLRLDTVFPQPLKGSTLRRMNGAPAADLTKDPLEHYANEYVKAMPGREAARETAERRAKLFRRDPRPARDWEQEKRDHIEMVRERELGKLELWVKD